MRIAAVQMHPRFAQLDYNRILLQRYCEKAAKQEVDLLVFPELCVTGYNFISRKQVELFAEPVPSGPSTQLWIKLAEEFNLNIVGGLAERSNTGRVFNSAVVVGTKGFLGSYRKIHLFAREKKWFLAGNQPPQVWKLSSATIGALVCFDWAFPEVSRILMLEGCEILCLPANLILPYAQRTMIARSIENRIFTVVANRIGSEGKLTFTGRSQITDIQGEILARGATKRTGLLMADIDPKQARDKFLTATNHVVEDRRIALYYRLLQP